MPPKKTIEHKQQGEQKQVVNDNQESMTLQLQQSLPDQDIENITQNQNLQESTKSVKIKSDALNESTNNILYSKEEDPLSMIDKESKDVTEVYMGRRNIKNIHPNFRKLTNLEVLWLNNNKVSILTTKYINSQS